MVTQKASRTTERISETRIYTAPELKAMGCTKIGGNFIRERFVITTQLASELAEAAWHLETQSRGLRSDALCTFALHGAGFIKKASVKSCVLIHFGLKSLDRRERDYAFALGIRTAWRVNSPKVTHEAENAAGWWAGRILEMDPTPDEKRSALMLSIYAWDCAAGDGSEDAFEIASIDNAIAANSDKPFEMFDPAREGLKRTTAAELKANWLARRQEGVLGTISPAAAKKHVAAIVKAGIGGGI